MKAVLYCRFSSDSQREESIDGQIRECTEFCKKNNIEIVGTYVDRALSASKGTEKRLEFQRMIRDSAKGFFDVVLVWKLDRFARNRYDSAHYKNILKKNHVKVISATERIGEGPEGIILESLLEGMAEYYSAELSEKIQRGQKENALKGRNNGGRVPYGYQLVNHYLQIDPETAPVILEVFKRYADGESVRSIVDDLKRRGIKSRMGYEFTYSSFGNMLKNRTYIGEFHYDGTVIPGGVPAIVPQDIFNRAQVRREKNRHAPAVAKAEELYLLTTKLFCGKCNRMMAGESGTGSAGKIYRYYKCGNVKYKKGCNKKSIKKDWIENLVIQQTMLMVMDDGLVDRLVEHLVKLQGEESNDLKILEKQEAKVEQGIANMLNAIQAGIITPSTQQRLKELEEQKGHLERRILQERIQQPILSREQIAYYIYRFRETDVQDERQRQLLIDSFVNSVYVFDEKIVLTFNYKDGSKTIRLDDIKSSDLGDNAPPSKTPVISMITGVLVCLDLHVFPYVFPVQI